MELGQAVRVVLQLLPSDVSEGICQEIILMYSVGIE